MSTPAPKTPQAAPVATVADIDRALQTGIVEKTYSAAACIASAGERIFHRAVYGSPVTPPPLRKVGFDLLFDLASLTKPLGTGLAALWLAGRGRMDLGASLAKTLPELKADRFKAVTIDMLLDHSAGFAAVPSFWEELRDHDAKCLSAERLLGTRKAVPFGRDRLGSMTLQHEPGSKTLYSDLGFIILGWIIEHVTGEPLDIFLEREIYRPLGVSDELFFVRLDDERRRQRLRTRTFAATENCPWRKKLLQGEAHDPNAWALGGVAGHAGLFGTVDAVHSVVKALWQAYRGEGKLFASGTVRRFWTRSKRIADTTRTLAWDTPSAIDSSAGKRFSKNSVGHLGYTGCSVWIDLSTDIIGVVLTNTAHPTREGKEPVLAKLRPRVYELIAKYGEALGPDPKRPTGARAFYSGPIVSGPARPGPTKMAGKK